MAQKAAATLSDDVLAMIHDGLFSPVVEKCTGCERIVTVDDNQYCRSYASPAAKWKLGICNFATHEKPEIATAKTRVNPLKASKRAMARRK